MLMSRACWRGRLLADALIKLELFDPAFGDRGRDMRCPSRNPDE
jgi:hypothetical protein